MLLANNNRSNNVRKKNHLSASSSSYPQSSIIQKTTAMRCEIENNPAFVRVHSKYPRQSKRVQLLVSPAEYSGRITLFMQVFA